MQGDKFLKNHTISIKDIADVKNVIGDIIDKAENTFVSYSFPETIKLKEDKISEDKFGRQTYNVYGYKTTFLDTVESYLKDEYPDESFISYNVVLNKDATELKDIVLNFRFKDERINVNMFQAKH